jgi:hypothetical protein
MGVRVLPLSGCMNVMLGVCTLGIAPLAQYLTERSWPKTLGEGLVARGGTRIAWDDVTRITHVTTNVNGAQAERYELRTMWGKVNIVVPRLERGREVLAYVLDHVPEGAFAHGD